MPASVAEVLADLSRNREREVDADPTSARLANNLGLHVPQQGFDASAGSLRDAVELDRAKLAGNALGAADPCAASRVPRAAPVDADDLDGFR
jgi:hypothetical protein